MARSSLNALLLAMALLSPCGARAEAPSEPTPAPGLASPAQPEAAATFPGARHDRARDLQRWRPAIVRYSQRHYGEATSDLTPTCIVLHYTAGTTFPWNLVRSSSFAGEAPGLASHYVIDGTTVWQLLPDRVRSRGAYGINHRAINIEMVAANASDLARRPKTLETCARLVAWLQSEHSIPTSKIYSHSAVSTMDRRKVPEVKDLVRPEPYGKPDPGDTNMKKVYTLLRSMRQEPTSPSKQY